MPVGSKIEANDYNSIRSKIVSVMGSGSGTIGYGQPIVSSPVSAGNKITKLQWDQLRYDIINARVHQEGVPPTIMQTTVGSPVSYGAGNPNTQYSSLADIAILNKFKVGVGQLVSGVGTTVSRSSSWNSSVSTTVTITFGSADYARWFFNSGGKIVFNSNRTGGTSTAQNTSWSNLLTLAGSYEFSATSLVNFFSANNVTNAVCFSLTSTGTYVGTYSIRVQANISNNSAGGATTLTFLVSWVDGYTYSGTPNPTDLIDGTLLLTVSELKASGILQPAGIGPFVVVSPSYSATSISGA